MRAFSDFIVESKDNMEGNIGSEKKGLRHVVNYILPYLSKSEKQQVAKNFSKHIDPKKITAEHGEKHNPDSKATTHILGSDVNGHKAGTPVRVTGARHDDQGRIFVQTAKHGEMQLSKLKKPSELKRGLITKGGFDVESRLAKNLGTKAAGSTGTAYDFYYRGHEGGIIGKARKIETDKPYLRGESKQNKAKMGESALKFDPKTKKWRFTHEKLGSVFEKAVHPDSGMPILDHLNKFHKDGVIQRGFTLEAPKGMTRNYLGNLGVNSLHLHRTEAATAKKEAIDHGTTYTIGDDNDLAGKTNLGHLSNNDIDRLDGKLNIESTTTGNTKIVHKPHAATFREYADNSKVNPGAHGDLTDEGHARNFLSAIDKHLSSKHASSLGIERPTERSAQQIPVQRPVKNPIQKTARKSFKKMISPKNNDEDQISAMTSEGGREPPEKVNHSGKSWLTPHEQNLIKSSR